MQNGRIEPPRTAAALIASAAGAASAAECFDAWCDSMRPAQDILPAQGNGAGRRVASTGWLVDDLFFNDLELSPVTYRRRPHKVGDYVLIRMYREGRAEGVSEDTAFRTRPGEIHLFDQAPEARGATTGWHHMQSVFMPYSAIRYEPKRHPAHVRVDLDQPVGRMLWSAMESVFAELPGASRAEASLMAAGFAGLVRSLVLGGDRSAGSSCEFDAARRLAMRRFLDEHLDDPELGVASLCAAFGASRATIYRDFADEGGVARFVTRRRLERAYRDLAGGPPDRGRVRRIAERWGFACPYHFSRVFRKRFDLWPSEVFEAGARNDA